MSEGLNKLIKRIESIPDDYDRDYYFSVGPLEARELIAIGAEIRSMQQRIKRLEKVREAARNVRTNCICDCSPEGTCNLCKLNEALSEAEK